MKMTIGGYNLETDAYNFILKRMKVSKTGQMRGELVSVREHYFSTLSQALNFLVLRELQEADLSDLKEIVKLVDELKEIILAAIEKAGLENNAIVLNKRKSE